MNENAYPYAATRAARILREALAKTTSKNPGGLRAIAARLDMKQAVNLSRMANGRMPIPLERAAELAEILDVDPKDFSLAVVEQRAPSVHAILADASDNQSDRSIGPLASKLRRVLVEANSASEEQVEIVGQVLADRKPSERWVKLSEVPMIKLIRDIYPDGPTMTDLEFLRSTLEVLDAARWVDTK